METAHPQRVLGHAQTRHDFDNDSATGDGCTLSGYIHYPQRHVSLHTCGKQSLPSKSFTSLVTDTYLQCRASSVRISPQPASPATSPTNARIHYGQRASCPLPYSLWPSARRQTQPRMQVPCRPVALDHTAAAAGLIRVLQSRLPWLLLCPAALQPRRGRHMRPSAAMKTHHTATRRQCPARQMQRVQLRLAAFVWRESSGGAMSSAMDMLASWISFPLRS